MTDHGEAASEHTSAPTDVRVWLSDWQIAEYRTLLSIGDRVDWQLTPVDRDWVTRLFGDAHLFDLALDTYAGLPGEAAFTPVSGQLTRLERVWCAQERALDGIVPKRGAARLESTFSTEASWASGAAHSRGAGDRTSLELDAENLYGYRATIDTRG
jgi:hypothetical protein